MKGMKEKLGSGMMERRDRAACMQALHWCYVSALLVGKDVPLWVRNQDLPLDHTVMSDIWVIVRIVKPGLSLNPDEELKFQNVVCFHLRSEHSLHDS